LSLINRSSNELSNAQFSVFSLMLAYTLKLSPNLGFVASFYMHKLIWLRQFLLY